MATTDVKTAFVLAALSNVFEGTESEAVSENAGLEETTKQGSVSWRRTAHAWRTRHLRLRAHALYEKGSVGGMECGTSG